MGLPFMLPEENIAGRGFGLGRPVILHIVEQLHLLLKDGAVKGAEGSSGDCVGPYAVNGEALTESGSVYLSQRATWL